MCFRRGTFNCVILGQTKSFPADSPEGAAGEVVHHRIQHTVEVGQADADEKCSSQVVQARADFRWRPGAGCFMGPDPKQHLYNVAWKVANDEEHIHQH